MGRPAKSVGDLSPTTRISNAERDARERAEGALMGPSDALAPPESWKAARKESYWFLAGCFPERSLCNMDAPLLQELTLSIERKAMYDSLIDADPRLLEDVQVRQARESCRKSMRDCMADLGMSRSARAKVANHAAAAAEKAVSVWDAASK